MRHESWTEFRLPSQQDVAWELFHENSKTGRYDFPVPDEVVLATMAMMPASLSPIGCPVVALPTARAPLHMPLEQAILSRVTCQRFVPGAIAIDEMASLLHCAYGITRGNENSRFPRPFRVVPSAGALYPLELYVHCTRVDGLPPGLYHYDPGESVVRRVRDGDQSDVLAEALVQDHLARDAAAIVCITAMFERTVFKYGDRGYRFVLLEAGHVAQNIDLVCTALGLGCVDVGGYFDRRVDEFLELDGLAQSTVYVIAIGRAADGEAAALGDA